MKHIFSIDFISNMFFPEKGEYNSYGIFTNLNKTSQLQLLFLLDLNCSEQFLKSLYPQIFIFFCHQPWWIFNLLRIGFFTDILYRYISRQIINIRCIWLSVFFWCSEFHAMAVWAMFSPSRLTNSNSWIQIRLTARPLSFFHFSDLGFEVCFHRLACSGASALFYMPSLPLSPLLVSCERCLISCRSARPKS